MDNSSVGHALASVVLKVLKLYDSGKLTLEDTKQFICHAVEVADGFNCDVSLVTELMQDRCSVCLKKFEDEELVDWSPETSYEEGDTRATWAKVAFNNCFGEIMVGGKVCQQCAEQLPPEGPME